MKMHGGIVLGVAGALALLALPVLAQGHMGSGGGIGPGGGQMGPGGGYMQGNPQPTGPTTGRPLSISQAQVIASRVVAQSGYSGLFPGHIMEFSNNFYVAVKQKTNDKGAYEFLIDRYTGFVHPEPQSMMWNTQFGHMAGWGGAGYGGAMGPGYGGGMMGPGYGSGGPGAVQPGGKPLTLAQARAQAQQFLDARLPGTKTDEAITFPGYYTIDVSRNGKVIGMLSVNAYTGAVWYHTWHGTFVEEKDLD